MHTSNLKVVADRHPPTSPLHHRALVVRPPLPARVVTIERRQIAVPLVSLLLLDYCELGPMLDTESEYGRQPSGKLAILWRGAVVSLTGALVPLVTSAHDVLLPLTMPLFK